MAVYIFNRQFQESLMLYKALKRFLGIGKTRMLYLLSLLGLTKRAEVRHVSWHKSELASFYLRVLFIIDSQLVKYRNFYLYRIHISGNYRSFRHEAGMPSNGQRSHTNASTCRAQRGRFVVTELKI